MWVARVLKRPVDKSNAPSLSRAEFKKIELETNRSFVTLARHLRLVATIQDGVTTEFRHRTGPPRQKPTEAFYADRQTFVLVFSEPANHRID